jgi:hypothetical protein
LGAVIPISSIEAAFVEDTIREALRVASPVVVVYSDHLSDGTREDLGYVERLRATLSAERGVLWVPVAWFPGPSSRFWIRYLRWAGFPFLTTDFVLWLDADEVLDAPRFGVEQRAAKVFHVSPFCPVEGGYRFRFMVDPTRHRTVGRIDYDDASGPLLQTSVCGTLQALDARTTRQALWRYPAMTLGVVLRIHWQALKLFAKRVQFFTKPVPPTVLTTR